MGRNYISERTIADPNLRKAFKKERARKARERRYAEAALSAEAKERAKWCATGCGQPASPHWNGCCDAVCFRKLELEAIRRFEVRMARLAGIPVAEWRRRSKDK